MTQVEGDIHEGRAVQLAQPLKLNRGPLKGSRLHEILGTVLNGEKDCADCIRMPIEFNDSEPNKNETERTDPTSKPMNDETEMNCETVVNSRAFSAPASSLHLTCIRLRKNAIKNQWLAAFSLLEPNQLDQRASGVHVILVEHTLVIHNELDGVCGQGCENF